MLKMLSEQAGARKRKRLEEQHRSAEEDLRVTIRDLRDELTRGQKRTSELVATLRSDLQDARRDASLRASDARAKNAKAALELREEIARREAAERRNEHLERKISDLKIELERTSGEALVWLPRLLMSEMRKSGGATMSHDWTRRGRAGWR